MTSETMTDLSNGILIGYADKRGDAWWTRAGGTKTTADGRPNHFDGPVPMERAIELLDRVTPIGVPLECTLPAQLTADGVTEPRHIVDESRKVILDRVTGEVYGIFGADYVIHEYRPWLLDTVGAILDDDLGIGSVGLLRGGAVGFVQVELPEPVQGPGGFDFRPYLLAMTSLDGSRPTGFSKVATAVVCDNTLDIASREDGPSVQFKHTAGSAGRILDVRKALGLVHQSTDDIVAELDSLLSIKVDDRQWDRFVTGYLDLTTHATKRSQTIAEGKRAQLTHLYRTDPRVTPWKGTGLGAMNAVSTWEQHLAPARGLDKASEGRARYGRSLMKATDGTLAAQADKVRRVLTSVAS